MTNRIGERIRFHRLALSVLSLFLIAGLAIVDDYGVSMDTGSQFLVGINTFNYVLHGDPTLLQTHDRFYGAAFEAPLLLLTERVPGLEDPRHVYLTRHVLTHLFFSNRRALLLSVGTALVRRPAGRAVGHVAVSPVPAPVRPFLLQQQGCGVRQRFRHGLALCVPRL